MAAQDKEIFEATEELYLEPGTKAPPNSPLLAAQAHHIHRLDLEQAAFAFPFETHGYDTSADTMVQLTEVVDEHFQESQPGPEDDDDYSDTDSEISTESDYDPLNETLGERLYALRDIIPPQTRSSIYNGVSNTAGAVKSVLSFGGKTMWVIATSALLLGVPWALAFSEEQQIIDMEKEMKMREMGGELLTAGGSDQHQGSATAQQVGAALGTAEAKPAL